MSNVTNEDVCHDFFWSLQDYEYSSSGNVHYRGNVFYSYGTCIAVKTWDKENNVVLLISENGYSATTRKHKSSLIHACPGRWIHCPVSEYGSEDINAIVKEMVERLDKNVKNHHDYFKHAESRRDFKFRLGQLEQLLDLPNVKKVNASKMAKFKLYAEIAESLSSRDKYMDFYAKERAEEQKKAKVAREHNKALFASFDKLNLMGKLRKAYTPCGCGLRPIGEEQGKLSAALVEEYMTSARRPSFIDFFDSETVVTSQGVRMSASIVKAAIRRYLNGSLQVGQHIGPYMVQRLDDKYVQVGCHLIPMENIMGIAMEMGLK